MDLMVRELDQLRLCCSEPVVNVVDTGFEHISIFELDRFFQHCLQQGKTKSVLEGMSWLFCHAQSSTLRARMDNILTSILALADENLAWQLACLFATGCASRIQWEWSQLRDTQKVQRCLEHASAHPRGKYWLAFYRHWHQPEPLNPAAYHELPLALAACRRQLSTQPQVVCRVLERLVRCGSLSAWELLQQSGVHGQKPVIHRWRDAMHADPFPFVVHGMRMVNRGQLLRWALRHSPEQLADCYTQLNRQQWFALLHLLDAYTRYLVVEAVWQRYGMELRL